MLNALSQHFSPRTYEILKNTTMPIENGAKSRFFQTTGWFRSYAPFAAGRVL
jgi:hypothetical protein